MPGIRSLRRIQLAKEATAGTQLNATTIWRGTGTLKNDAAVVHPAEDIGVVMDTDRVYIASLGGTLTLDAVPATFEQLPYLFEMGVKAVGTGSSDSTGTGYVYTYALPTTTKNTINTYSVEAGDDQQMERAAYAFAETIKLAGKFNAAVEMSGTIKTRTVSANYYSAATIAATSTNTLADSASGFGFLPTGGGRLLLSGTTLSASNGVPITYTAATTASISGLSPAFSTTFAAGSTITVSQWFSTASIPTVEEILFQKGKLYIDPSTGSWGATLQSNTFLSFELDLKTGWKGQPTGDNRLDFSFAKSTKPTGTLKVTFEHDGVATAEKAAWLAKTARLVRVLVQGNALTTPGGAYSYKTLIVDVVGRWKDFTALQDDKGNDTVTGTMDIGYDSSAASSGQIVIVNQLSSLP